MWKPNRFTLAGLLLAFGHSGLGFAQEPITASRSRVGPAIVDLTPQDPPDINPLPIGIEHAGLPLRGRNEYSFVFSREQGSRFEMGTGITDHLALSIEAPYQWNAINGGRFSGLGNPELLIGYRMLNKRHAQVSVVTGWSMPGTGFSTRHDLAESGNGLIAGLRAQQQVGDRGIIFGDFHQEWRPGTLAAYAFGFGYGRSISERLGALVGFTVSDQHWGSHQDGWTNLLRMRLGLEYKRKKMSVFLGYSRSLKGDEQDFRVGVAFH